MPLIQISSEQSAAATANGDDTADALEFGVYDEAMVEVSPPLDGFTAFTPDIQQTIKDGAKQLFAISSRFWQPIGDSINITSPSFNVTSAGDLDVSSLSLTTYSARKVMISLNLSAYTNVANTCAGFYVKINGSGLSPSLQYYFNEALSHRSMGGTWVTTLPATGLVTVTATVGVASGTGHIILDTSDIISLSVIG